MYPPNILLIQAPDDAGTGILKTKYRDTYRFGNAYSSIT
jgi:hypothetical protein